jgi:hypothetical protein
VVLILAARMEPITARLGMFTKAGHAMTGAAQWIHASITHLPKKRLLMPARMVAQAVHAIFNAQPTWIAEQTGM